MSAGVSAAAAEADAAADGDSAGVEAAGTDAAALLGDGVLPPPVEQAPSSTSSDAPRASVRFNRMGLSSLIVPRAIAARSG